MKQEKFTTPPVLPGTSRPTPYIYTPASIYEEVVQSSETDIKRGSPSPIPEREARPAFSTSRLTPYIYDPASLNKDFKQSTTPDIKQESPRTSPDREVKQESSEPLGLPSPSLRGDTLCGDLNVEVYTWMRQVEMQDSSTPATITPNSTPEPEDTNEHMCDSMAAQPLLDAEILRSYGPATKRLLLFDYDGTLTDIVTNPKDAVLPPMVLFTIQTLASEPKNAVWIISGRDQRFLASQFGSVSAMGLVAEHGAFIRYPGQETWLNLTEGNDMSWKSEVDAVCQKAMKRTPGSRIETKCAAVVWHYREADPQDGAREARELRTRLNKVFASKARVEVIEGKCVIEARLNFINKGAIVQRILTEFEKEKEEFPDFVLCIGDDVTDEGMYPSSVLEISCN